jgi:hypothetical protein
MDNARITPFTPKILTSCYVPVAFGTGDTITNAAEMGLTSLCPLKQV